MAAALRSWQDRLVELEESEAGEHGEEEERRRGQLGPVVGEIVRQSHDYVDIKDLIRVDTKYHRLKTILAGFLHNYRNEKVVVFSAFRATLAYLHERLGGDGISCIQFKGGQRQAKDEILSTFGDPDGPKVLLSSEVGGEGVDLQFSRLAARGARLLAG